MHIFEKIYNVIDKLDLEEHDVEIDPELFDSLAVELARYQLENNPAYARYARVMSTDISLWRGWSSVLSLPVTTWKRTKVYTGTTVPEREWKSSGTTGTDPSISRLQTTDMYDLVIRKEMKHFIPDHDQMLYLMLMPNSSDWPNSSLSYMYSRYLEGQPYEYPVEMMGEKFKFDMDGVYGIFQEAVKANQPITTLTTSYALVTLLDHFATKNYRFKLPEKSCVVHTGGFKGLSREMSPEEIGVAAEYRLGIPNHSVVGEYGMSELSSQFWTTNYLINRSGVVGDLDWANQAFMAPPWVRVQKVDPYTQQVIEDEDPENGVLQIFDLANIWTCASILTEDRVFIYPNDKFITPKGRAPQADLKGCSLNVARSLETE